MPISSSISGHPLCGARRYVVDGGFETSDGVGASAVWCTVGGSTQSKMDISNEPAIRAITASAAARTQAKSSLLLPSSSKYLALQLFHPTNMARTDDVIPGSNGILYSSSLFQEQAEFQSHDEKKKRSTKRFAMISGIPNIFEVGNIINEGNTIETSTNADHRRSSKKESSVSKAEEYHATSLTSRPKKFVSFDLVHIRCYELIVGDHPLCSSGCPLTFGWKYQDEPAITIQEHEESINVDRNQDHSKQQQKQRRRRHQLRTTCQERHELLVRQIKNKQQQGGKYFDQRGYDETVQQVLNQESATGAIMTTTSISSPTTAQKTSSTAAAMAEIRLACRRQQRHDRDPRIRKAEQFAFFNPPPSFRDLTT